jgi:hypothetical protein
MTVSFAIGDNGQTLIVTVTGEGVIMDALDCDGAVIGTVGMMANEWYSFILSREGVA